MTEHSSEPVPAQPYAAHPYAAQVAPKNPVLSAVISFFIPGLGSMLNGAVPIGLTILIGYFFSYFLMLLLIGFLTAPAFWIWGIVHGYTSAQKWNAAHGVVS